MRDLYADRASYRVLSAAADLVYFRVTEGETDLFIGAGRRLEKEAFAAVLGSRALVRQEIARRPAFQSSLSPLDEDIPLPDCIRAMYAAGKTAGTGPMAAVAGMIAEYTGRALLPYSGEVTVENGGDVFLAGMRQRVIAIAAGQSPLSGKLGIKVIPGTGFAVCTSSGTYGHSLSFGRADAAVVAGENAALCDAAATMLGNRCKSEADLAEAVEWAAALPGVSGAVAVIGDKLAAAGGIELTAV